MKQKVNISISFVHDDENAHVPVPNIKIYVDDKERILCDVPKNILFEIMTQCDSIHNKLMNYLVKSV